MGGTVPFPPPLSCSPLSGKSSSKTTTESLPVGRGVGSTSTLTGWVNAEVVVHAFVPPRMLQAGGMEAPLMVWPQAVFPAAASAPLQACTLTLEGDGLAASPGRPEM